MSDPLLLTGEVTVAGRPEHVCQARFRRMDLLELVTESPSRIDDEAICRLCDIGVLPGRVDRLSDKGFLLNLSLSGERLARITVRLAWHTARASWTAEQRADPRIVPDHRDVVVRLPDGQALNGSILDLSKSGAKIDLPPTVEVAVGSIVTVGKRYAVVVRPTETGFAVRFQLPFTDLTFNPSVVL